MEYQLFFSVLKIRKFILIALLVALPLIFGSCSPPTELDGPVKITPKDREKAFIRPEISYFSFSENGVEESSFDYDNKEKFFLTGKTQIYVDTLTQPPRIWFRVMLYRNRKHSDEKVRRISIREYNFNLDSFPVLGIPLSLRLNEYPRSWVKLMLRRGPKDSQDTLVDPCSFPNSLEINCSLNKPYREIWLTGYGKIFDSRFETIFRDTTVIDSVKKTRLDTVWVNDKPIVKEVEYWEKKEIKLKIEETTAIPDSLILNFKFRMKY